MKNPCGEISLPSSDKLFKRHNWIPVGGYDYTSDTQLFTCKYCEVIWEVEWSEFMKRKNVGEQSGTYRDKQGRELPKDLECGLTLEDYVIKDIIQ